MRIGVLSSPDSWYFKDLQRAAAHQHELTVVTFSQIFAAIDDSHAVHSGEFRLDQFDALLVRTMPPGSLEQVVFRMDALGQLAARGCVVINSPRAIETAVDKYLTTARIHAAHLLTPDTFVCQTADEAMDGFARLGGDVVIKPLFGSEGRGITRVIDENIALRAFKTLAQLNAVIYLQRFIEHEGFDVRVLVVGDRMWGIHRRNPLDWRTNVSRGASAEPCELDDKLCDMARRASACVGASMSGVDILPGRDGRDYVLEVNAVPGWKALARALKIDVAQIVLEHVAAMVDAAR